MTYFIRATALSDAAAICVFCNPYVLHTNSSFEKDMVSREEMAQRINEMTASLPSLVCGENTGNIIQGYAYAVTWRSRATYVSAVESSVYLSQAGSGKGLRTLLYKALLEALKKFPKHKVIGAIALPNPVSIALHGKMGFKKVGVFRAIGNKSLTWIDLGYWQCIIP